MYLHSLETSLFSGGNLVPVLIYKLLLKLISPTVKILLFNTNKQNKNIKCHEFKASVKLSKLLKTDDHSDHEAQG